MLMNAKYDVCTYKGVDIPSEGTKLNPFVAYMKYEQLRIRNC